MKEVIEVAGSLCSSTLVLIGESLAAAEFARLVLVARASFVTTGPTWLSGGAD